jgi:spore coat polysaccharide biosynthesis protein SpsF (cytidylyltransferase family)
MRIGCIIQARMNSTRLPGKMLADLGGRPVLWHTLQRAKAIGIPVIVAMILDEADELLPIMERCEVSVFQAYLADNDVLGRYYGAAKGAGLDAVMRICGDQPLLDPSAAKNVLHAFQTLYIDWCANDYHPSYPKGLGVEVFSFAALELAHQQAKKPQDREHVSPWITRHSQMTGRNIRCPINGISDLRLTIDTQEDLDFVRRIDAAGPKDFSLRSTLEAVERAQIKDHA